MYLTFKGINYKIMNAGNPSVYSHLKFNPLLNY